MKTSSSKFKGRRLQQNVVKQLRKHYALDNTEEDYYSGDIQCTLMGASGVDVKLSPKAKELIPFDVECKNTEKASVWQWIKQAETNTNTGRTPLIVFKRNHSDTYAIIQFEDLLKLLK